jgi:hypothetical protein
MSIAQRFKSICEDKNATLQVMEYLELGIEEKNTKPLHSCRDSVKAR